MSIPFKQKVRDTVTGFQGTVIGRAEFLDGRKQVCVIPSVDAGGEYPEKEWLYEGTLELLDAENKPVGFSSPEKKLIARVEPEWVLSNSRDAMNAAVDWSIGAGPYRVSALTDGRLLAFRHGDEWRDCTGDKLIYQLGYALVEAYSLSHPSTTQEKGSKVNV